MAKQGSSWKRTRQRGTPGYVGEFFEGIGARLVRGKQTSQTSSVDVEVSRARAIVEVKGCGCNPARLRRLQFLSHQTILDDQGHVFFDIMPYLIFFYRARRKNEHGVSGSIFKGCRDRTSHWHALALHTTDALIIDHQLIDRLPVRSLDGVFPDGANGESGSCLRKSDIPELLGEYGAGLGLTHTIHRVRTSIRIGLLNHTMRFSLSAILSEKSRAQMGVVIPQLLLPSSDAQIYRRMKWAV